MAPAPTVRQLVARRADLVAELAASRREYGDVRAAAIVAHSRAFREANGHMNVTERREYCKIATADLDADVAKLHGECSALEAEIEHIDVQLEYHDADAS